MMASVTVVVLIPVGNICKTEFKFRLLFVTFYVLNFFIVCFLKEDA